MCVCPFSPIKFVIIFSHSVGLLHFLHGSVYGMNVFNSEEIQFIFSFVLAFCYSKEPLSNPRSQRFNLMFSSTSFTVLALTFGFLIHIVLILHMVCGKNAASFCACRYPAVSVPVLKRLFFLHRIVLELVSKINLP